MQILGAGVNRRCVQYLRKYRLWFVHSFIEPLTHCVYVERFYFQIRNSRHIFCKREVLCAKISYLLFTVLYYQNLYCL